MSDRFTATISIHKTHIKKFPELEALIRAEFYSQLLTTYRSISL